MKVDYILKLVKKAPKKQEVPLKKRYADPLAVIKANQVGVSQGELENGEMREIMAKITNNLKAGNIKTASGFNNVFSPLGLTSRIAFLHSQPTISDMASKINRILASPWMTRQGYKGSWDAVAFANAMTDPNVMKGKGEKMFSIAKNKDLASNITPGRNVS